MQNMNEDRCESSPLLSSRLDYIVIITILLSVITANRPVFCISFGIVPFLLIQYRTYTAKRDRMQLSSESFEWIGERLYFLGYLGTITAFGASMIRFAVCGVGTDSPRMILLMGGIALVTTVSGLFSMNVMRSIARQMRPVSDQELTFSSSKRSEPELIEHPPHTHSSADVPPIIQNITQSPTPVTENEIVDDNAWQTQFAAFSKRAAKTEDAWRGAEEYAQKSIASMLELVNMSKDTCAQIHKSLTTLNTTIDEVNRGLRINQQEASDMKVTLSATKNHAISIKSDVEQVDQALDQMVNKYAKVISNRDVIG